MALPGVRGFGVFAFLPLSGLLVVGLPLPSNAERPGRQRSLTEKLRDGPGLANHPVGVVPSSAISIPGGWPLDFDGSITCLTCHETLPRLDGSAGPHLRDFDAPTADSTGFCLRCHSPANRRDAASMHWMALRRAHVKPTTDRSWGSGDRIDAESRSCLGCHDGVTASESRNPAGAGRGGGSLADPGRNHPIAVRYPTRQRGDFDVPFRPVSALPQEVRLPGGKVSCVSCHNLYAPGRKLLAVPIEGSQLCFTCHQLD